MSNEKFPKNAVAILQSLFQVLSILKVLKSFINTFANLHVDNVQFVKIIANCILQYGKNLIVPHILQLLSKDNGQKKKKTRQNEKCAKQLPILHEKMMPWLFLLYFQFFIEMIFDYPLNAFQSSDALHIETSD